MAHVFISYSRQSKTIVNSLIEDIETIGQHQVWFDQELSGGQAWLEQIRACDIFVFAVAQSALDSTACKREADYAASLGKPVLPILIEDGISTNVLPPV